MENHHFERVSQPKNGDLTGENDDLAMQMVIEVRFFSPKNYK